MGRGSGHLGSKGDDRLDRVGRRQRRASQRQQGSAGSAGVKDSGSGFPSLGLSDPRRRSVS